MKSIPFSVDALQVDEVARELASVEGFHGRAETWAILGSLVLVGLIVELIRRGQLKERYSLLWFATAIATVVLALQREWLEALARGLGIYYAPSALFLVFFGFIVLILIHYSTVISKLLRSQQSLAQKLGVIESRLAEMQRVEEDGASSREAKSAHSNPSE